MKIVIVGVGQVGSTLAEYLVGEKHEIVVIDVDRNRLKDLSFKLDIGTVLGSGSYPAVLDEAGCGEADIIIAVTNSDETNMLACQVAHTIFKTPLKIARVRSQHFHAYKDLFADEAIPIDVIITPENEVTDFVMSLIEYPGAWEVATFAQGKIKLLTIKVTKDSILYDKTISQIYQLFNNINFKIAAVSYEGQARIDFTDSLTIANNFHIVFLLSTFETDSFLTALNPHQRLVKNIMIAGGGNIGYNLARRIGNHYNVKIIDYNKERCIFLAEKLDNVLILRGDASDSEILRNENIADTDLFCALTENDAINIMSSLLAKRLGARKVLSLITRDVYAELMEGSTIDVAISPQAITLGAVLKHIRKGDVEQVYSMDEGMDEVLEFIVHGEPDSSDIINKCAADIALPVSSKIVAVVREDRIFFEIDEVIIQPLDHVIIFVTDKKDMQRLEDLFQADVAYH